MTLLARAGILWLRFKAWWRETLYKARVRLFGRLAVEAATEGRTALHAVDMDSPEGDIQAASQRAAWTTQIGRLENIATRNRDQEYLLRQLRRNVRELDAREARTHATPSGMGGQRLAAFGAVSQRRGLLGPIGNLAGGWQVWAIAGAITLSGWGMAAVQAAIKERVEDQRDAARAEVEQLEANRVRWAEALAAERTARAHDVAGVLEDTARTVESLQRQEARRRAREARERSRNEDLAHGTIDFGERLRELAGPADAGLPADPTAAPGSGPAGGMPDAPGEASDARHP